MLRSALLGAAALLFAEPAVAQEFGTETNCKANPSGVTLNQYVEARRPVISKRKLSGNERSEANKLMSDIKAGLRKKARIDNAQLDRLAVLGASGDKDIMRTLVEGYPEAAPVIVNDGGESWNARTKLAGLWAAQLWREGDRSKPVSKALANCIPGYSGTVKGRCGFDAKIEGSYTESFSAHWAGQGKAPKSATFTEHTLLQTRQEETARFELALADKVSGKFTDDRGWAGCWANMKGGEHLTIWNSSDQISWQNYKRAEEGKAVRAKDELDRNVAEWTALNARYTDVKTKGGKFASADYGRWVQLSYMLGGKYLEPYGSEAYLEEKTSIDSLCSATTGDVCDRQRRIYERIDAEARTEANMKEARWRAAIEDNARGSTAVRTYDQNGNYQGASTMPKWQADILSGN